MSEFAVVILTLNEENNISHCLEAILKSFRDVHVVDSGSLDNTIKISEEYAVRTYVNKQVGSYSAATQRNWALKNIKSSADWVIFIDADEIIDETFREHLILKINNDPEVEVISVPLMYYFHNKKVKSMGYPNWHDRIVKRTLCFSSSVGEYVNSNKRIYVRSAVIKHNFNSLGMRRFMEKQARYAEYIGKSTYHYLNGEDVDYFNKKDGNSRLKRSIVRLGLLRPFLRFAYQFFIKKGFLEGRVGFVIALYMSIFEFLIVVSIQEEALKESKHTL